MGSHSYESNCPNCGNDMESIVDTKPIQTIHHACIHCGWYCSPKYEQMSLDELNEQRKDWNENFYEEGENEELKPLTELPSCILNPYEAVQKRYERGEIIS